MTIPHRSSEPNVAIELITVERAHEYLGYNTHNRNLRDQVINAYASDMINGDWKWNGESIKFDIDGTLLDGQHRLAAVIKAERPIRLLVVRDLPSETQETMDGGAKRKFADILKLRGETGYTALATTIRGIVYWESGARGTGKHQPTNAELLTTLEKYPWVRDGLPTISHATQQAGLPAHVGGVAWWLFQQIDTEDADHFFERLISTEGHYANEPIHELRRAISNSFSVRGARSTRFLLAITVKAWNKFRAGEPVGLLTYRPGGAKPEAFPEPR